MTDFDTNLEHLNAEIDAGEYSDTVHVNAEVAAAYAAYYGLDVSNWPDWIDQADEAYAGQFGSDADFAEDMAESLGLINHEAAWPNNYIDWEAAADGLMQDYFKQEGYYFRIA